MTTTRRECLKLTLAAGVYGALAGCAKVGNGVSRLENDAITPIIPTSEEDRMLNRVGFGPNSQSLSDYRSLGQTAYVERELSGDRSEDLGLLIQLQRLDVLGLSPSDLWDIPYDVVLSQLQQAAILQAVYGNNQLRERMIDFWSNHFNIYARKGNTGYSKGAEEAGIVRKHALGRFPDMLNEMARSPAMLEYLDNETNQKGVPNENFARELMELHTLGLHGGYNQHDVQEVARCFTGWTIETRFLRPKGRFRFDEDKHDNNAKSVLGREIAAGGGESDGDQVLSLLSKHPSTARFLATKLSRYFLGVEDPRWIGTMSAAYLSNDGNIPAMLRPLLLSSALVDSGPVLKRPFDYLVSALRITEANADGGPAIQMHLDKMGQPLYQWPMPDGYPVKTASWTSSLLPRWNFAIALTHGDVPGASCPDDAIAELAKKSSPSGQNPTPQHLAALSLASPEFQWR